MSDWPLYNALDGAVTYEVWEAIKDEVLGTSYEGCYRQTIDLLPVLVFMSTRGMLVDQEALARETERCDAQTVSIERELHEMCGFRLNVNSSKQCQNYFYGQLGHSPYRGKTGGITTDDKAMARLARKEVKEAKLVQQIRTLKKLKNTYLSVSVDVDGRLRASFNPRGTRDGRISSSQNVFGTGLNFQNLDPRFKSFLRADPGYVLCELDKRQAEWVVTAYVSGDQNMIAVVESGQDPHIATAASMTGLDPELLHEENELVGHLTEPDQIWQLREEKMPSLGKHAKFLPRSMSCRQAGKKANHGCNYVLGYKRYALENEIEEKEAKQQVEAYRRSYPGLEIWWDRVKNQLQKDKTIINCFGRPRRFLDDWGPDLWKEAIAYNPQSTVADLVNRGLIGIYREAPDPATGVNLTGGVELLAQVHDSILFQHLTPKGTEDVDLEWAIDRSTWHLEPPIEGPNGNFEIKTDLKLGLNWGEISDTNLKGMKEVSLENLEQTLKEELPRLTA